MPPTAPSTSPMRHHAMPDRNSANMPARRHQQRRAQIRLLGNQRRRHRDEHADHGDVLPARRQLARVQIPGHHHRHSQLEQFGRLKAHHAQVEPAVGATAFAQYGHHHQQGRADGIQPRRPAAQHGRRDTRDHQQQHRAQHEAHRLATDHRQAAIARAVQREQTHRRQQHQAAGQRQVNARTCQHASQQPQATGLQRTDHGSAPLPRRRHVSSTCARQQPPAPWMALLAMA